MNQHVLRIGGRDYKAEIKDFTSERATVIVDGTEYVVDLVQFGRRTVSLDAVRPAPAAAAGAAPIATPRTAPPPDARGEGGIVAPMPGLVLTITAKEGDTVVAGQALLVMEAMKMENAVTAPYSGTVSKIYVREGDSIAEGDLLVHVSRPKLTAL